jgi:dihydrofolate synthase/folylpolyglutamate synthase
MLNTRDPATFLAPLAPHAASIRTLTIRGERNSWSAAETAAAARRIGLSAEPEEDLPDAIRAISQAHPAPGRILVCGSLYLAGTVLAGAA